MNELDYILVAAILLECVMIGLGLRRGQGQFPKNATLEQSFTILEVSLKQAYPDLPEGYTWSEVMNKLRSLDFDNIEWTDIETILKKYEAFRYGGVGYGNVEPGSVLRLARKLPRRRKVVS